MTKPEEPTTDGTVKFWDYDRGYGFIEMATGQKIFGHISQVSDECADPVAGDSVTFIEDRGRDGRLYARRIVVVNSA